MAELDFSRVRAVVAENNQMIRQGIRIGLNALGVREISETSSLTTAHQMLREHDVDVLVINSLLENNDATFLVRDIRHGNLGKDPFLLTMMVLPNPSEPTVRAAINCGTDDLLLIPFAPDQLTTRLRAITDKRRPFVVTHDYIGPDRRKQPRDGGPSASQFQVPHPVKARASGLAGLRYSGHVEEARGKIVRERIRRLAHSVEFEFREICGASRDGVLTADYLIPRLFELETTCEELVARLPVVGTDTGMVEAFLGNCRRMKSSASKVTYSELEAAYGEAKRITNAYLNLPEPAPQRVAVVA